MLAQETMQRIVKKLIDCKNMTSKELAQKLKVHSRIITKLYSGRDVSIETTFKISLPLIKLYCSTRWHKETYG